MKIIITGGCGYLGSKLVRVLEQEYFDKIHEIVVIDNLMYGQHYVPLNFDSDLVTLKRYQIFSPESCDAIVKEVEESSVPCVIFFLHALVGMPICNRYDEYMGKMFVETVNFKTIEHVVKELCGTKNPPLVIYPNTNSGYGNTKEICTEETPLNPISSYGESKLKAEEAIKTYCEKWVVFRLATLFGLSPRMRFDLLVNDLVYKSYFNGEINLFEPNINRNFVHVDDVAKIFSKFAFRQKHHNGLNEVYNLGNDAINCSKMELAKKIREQIDVKINVVDGKDPDQRNYIVSSKKLMGQFSNLGNQMTSLDYGILEILEFLKTLPLDPYQRSAVCDSLGFRNILENGDLLETAK